MPLATNACSEPYDTVRPHHVDPAQRSTLVSVGTCADVTPTLPGKVIVITGASSGIGAAAARQLTAHGATVIPVGRSVERSTALARSIGTEPVIADFADLADVRRLADILHQRCPRIDVLINNAGGLFTPRKLSVDGYETTLQVNHLAPFLLTALLRDRLVGSAATGPVRVINTASAANLIGRVRLDDLHWERRLWGSFRAYAATKLMNIMFTRELARRWDGTNVTTASFHPGPVATNFASGSWLPGLVYHTPLRSLLLINSEQGAAPMVWLASGGATDQVELDGGYYHRFHRNGPTHRQARDPELAAALWEASVKLVAAP